LISRTDIFRIIQTQFKISESASKIHDLATEWLNNWMKKNEKEARYLTWFDVIKLSEKAHERVNRILKEDLRK
jgi:hypothetical protein